MLGCTDPLAANYVAGANRDDLSCKYALTTPEECKDPNAKNYAPDAHGPGPGLGPLPYAGSNRSADPEARSSWDSEAEAAARRFEAQRAAAARAGAAWALAPRVVTPPES